MWKFLLIAIGLISAGCSHAPPLEENFKTVAGDLTSPNAEIGENRGMVIFYISPECPLCQNYTVAIRDIIETYSDENLSFLGVVSGEFYPREEVLKYQVRYDLDLKIVLDPDFKLAKYYAAEITPEAHLIDSNGSLLYKGAIDNWAISLGQKRQKPTEFYLASAIDAYFDNREINPKETKPVGCFIE